MFRALHRLMCDTENTVPASCRLVFPPVCLQGMVAAIICIIVSHADACTIAVISGRATSDGRPVLWKNRDFRVTQNEVIYFNDGQYACIGLVNAGTTQSVWMGLNEVGLCIQNSVSNDLGMQQPSDNNEQPRLDNGSFMLQALKTCASVNDVEQLLQRTDGTGRKTKGNFAVIDAKGGAVLFEAGPHSHLKFDANDPKIAPKGFIVRSNFSMTGQKFQVPPTKVQVADVYSGERYLRAMDLVEAGLKSQDTAQYLLKNCARDLANNGEACCGSVNGPPGELPDFIPTGKTISRSTSVSFSVFQGVKPDEDPLLTTMWIGLGDPKFSIAIPCWVASGTVSPDLQGNKGAPLCKAAISLRGQFYLQSRNGIRTTGLQSSWDRMWKEEDRTWQTVASHLNAWRENGIDRKSMQAIHLSAAEQALATISHEINSNIHPPAKEVLESTTSGSNQSNQE